MSEGTDVSGQDPAQATVEVPDDPEGPTGWLDPEWLSPLIATAVLILLVIAARIVAGRILKRRSWTSDEQRRRWVVALRNFAFMALLFGLVVIWAEQLRYVAVSLLAVAVAIILATKELLTCVTGSLLRSGARSFTIGDRIQFDDVRGEVVDLDTFSTVLLEIGPGPAAHQYTGRRITVPNSRFLDRPVFNAGPADVFVLHTFEVPTTRNRVLRDETLLLQAARECSADFLAEAGSHFEALSAKEDRRPASPEPRINLIWPDPDKVVLQVRLAVPPYGRHKTEQAILRRFLELSETAEPTGDDATPPA